MYKSALKTPGRFRIIGIYIVLQWTHWLCIFLPWTLHTAYAENSATINAYYILYQKGVIMNKDFCPRLQSNPFNPYVNESKEIILEFGDHISSQFSLHDECGFAFKRPSTGRHELMYLISSFLTSGKNSAVHFPNSIPCQDHIKFQWRALRKSVIPAAFCSGYRSAASVNVDHQHQQSRFDPLLWFNPVNQLGLYFKQSWNKSQMNITAHLVFRLLSGDGCEFRIQRYKVNSNCSTSDQLGYFVSNCEIIECNQEKQLLQWIEEIPWNLNEISKPTYENDTAEWLSDDYEPGFINGKITIPPIVPFLTIFSWSFLIYFCRQKWKRERNLEVRQQINTVTYTPSVVRNISSPEFVASAVASVLPDPINLEILTYPSPSCSVEHHYHDMLQTQEPENCTEVSGIKDEPPMYESLEIELNCMESPPTYEEALQSKFKYTKIMTNINE